MNRNSLSITWFALATCAGMLLVPTSLAQDPPTPTEDQDPPPSPTERSVPSYTATRVERAPVIDGHLNDDVWQLAPPGGPLLDADKNPGQPMTERTEFRVLYDQDHLYIGVWCFDSNPNLITARVMERDADLYVDDYLYILIDTFHDLRNGYVFALNPNGAKLDQLVSDNSNINPNWDGIWSAKTTIDSEGWKAEIAIPFRTLGFNPSLSRWGFNISRDIRRKFERGRWSSPRREVRTHMPSEAGVLSNLEGLHQGHGFEITPYLRGTLEHNHNDTDLLGDAGFDLRYNITPNLTATLSYNTDFAETDVDRRQLNFSRFPLFFPETRPFFLEDSGVFQFSGLDAGSSANMPGLRYLLIPYFSRQIGLSTDGEPVPIIAAAKLTGHLDHSTIGILDAVLDSHDNFEPRNAFVTRLAHQVGDQSTLGFLTTAGAPNAPGQNVVFGPDFRFRTTRLPNQQALEASVFGLGSYYEDQGTDWGHAFGGSLAYPNDLLRAQAQFAEISRDYRADLGFVSRTDVRAYSSYLSYRPRPESLPAVRNFFTTYRNEFYTSLDNQLESYDHRLTPLGLQLESGDRLSASALFAMDETDDLSFTIADVPIPPGHYEWLRGGLDLEFASKRPLAGWVGAWFGEYYGGTRLMTGFNADLLASRHINVSVDYFYNDFDLPEGAVATHLSSLRMVLNFSPDLTWSHLIQYDSVSSDVGYNSRIRWEYSPGKLVYLVLNQNYYADGLSLDVQDTALVLKLSGSWRF